VVISEWVGIALVKNDVKQSQPNVMEGAGESNKRFLFDILFHSTT
jgi:hypothetical protein